MCFWRTAARESSRRRSPAESRRGTPYGRREAFDYCREGDVLVVAKLDRLGRSLRELIDLGGELEGQGVGFRSLKESLDTRKAGRRLIFHVFGALRISDRTKADLERARRSGKVLGRPDGFESWAPVLTGMKEQGFSQGRMSRETGLAYNTVKKYLRRLEDG
jgi:DNA invertase Pin-like site-specific DNA recombinase